MSKEFAAMEEAAMKAYQEDLKRMEREAAGNLTFFLIYNVYKLGNSWEGFSLLMLCFCVTIRLASRNNNAATT